MSRTKIMAALFTLALTADVANAQTPGVTVTMTNPMGTTRLVSRATVDYRAGANETSASLTVTWYASTAPTTPVEIVTIPRKQLNATAGTQIVDYEYHPFPNNGTAYQVVAEYNVTPTKTYTGSGAHSPR